MTPHPNETLPPGWKQPLPAQLARPTYWPAMLALAVNIVLLGFVTLLPVALIGGALGALALIRWIGEMTHE